MKKSVALVVAGVAVLALVWYVSSSNESSQSAQVAPESAMMDDSAPPVYTRTELGAQEKRDLIDEYCNKNAQSQTPVTGAQLYEGVVISGVSGTATDYYYPNAERMAKAEIVKNGRKALLEEARKILAYSGLQGFPLVVREGYADRENSNVQTDQSVCSGPEEVPTDDGNKSGANCVGEWQGDVLLCLQG